MKIRTLSSEAFLIQAATVKREQPASTLSPETVDALRRDTLERIRELQLPDKSAVFVATTETGRKCEFRCEKIVDGVPVNPVLPANFDDTPNEQRSPRSMAWWGVPFIRIERSYSKEFVNHWKGHLRYDVRCLDGGAWDRSTCWGQFATLTEAVKQAKRNCPVWLNDL